jgi:glycosyltransferase involved in cell wall biosynthesis
MMKIALIGTRGIPAHYGGFETCAEELSKRLVEKGHEVWVYGRSGYYKKKLKEYEGIKLVYFPEIKIKTLDTLSHTFLSFVHSLPKKYDIILVFNYANSPILIFPKLLRKNVILHMDGLEWSREKWKGLGKKYLKFAEWLATRLSIDLISDSQGIRSYYKDKYGKNSHFIPYGAESQSSREKHLLERYNLKPQEYFLQITRFEPENNPLLSIRAFQRIETNKQLVLVGGVQYKTPYSEEIFSVKDPRINLLGFIYDKRIIRELLCNCYAYIHGNEVGGTNPALLEAMGSGCFVIARDVPFNREVLQNAGIYFQKNSDDVLEKMSWALQRPEETRKKGEEGRSIIRDRYRWDMVVDRYEKLFASILK